jgi:leucyl/phenylalanyl-tRNA--protein transferase
VIRRGDFRITFDKAFTSVMEGCMDRPDGSWITDEFIEAYGQCHQEGWAHSCEAWLGDELAGGVYGLALGSMFCGESMFSRQTNASKVALWALVEHLRGLGFRAFDCQIINDHTASLGAYEVSHRNYSQLLSLCLEEAAPWSR